MPKILNLIERLLNVLLDNTSYIMEEDESSEDEDCDLNSSFSTAYEVDKTFKLPTPVRGRHEPRGISQERKVEIIRLWEKHPNWNWHTLKRKGCPEIGCKATLYAWKKEVNSGTTSKQTKYREINKYTYEEMMKARSTYKIVNASHIRGFAMQKFQELKDDSFHTFKASESWLTRFKRRYGISSRKITRLVSKREVKSELEILISAEKFQTDIRSIKEYFDEDHIFNTDQCPFQYELASKRTLAKREKKLYLAMLNLLPI
jgi:Tc5 transposase-like DNA-binding protein